jgi:CheY-like chemotaxis protein
MGAFVNLSSSQNYNVMNKTGPVLIIDDDEDDRELLVEVFRRLKYENQLLLFSDGQQAYDYLLETSDTSFIILSDISMPKLTGLELKYKIESNEMLRSRGIPFIFFTTATTKKAISEVCRSTSQGFFIKPNSFKSLENCVKKIVDYWNDCQSPENLS